MEVASEEMDKYFRWSKSMDLLLLDCLKKEKAKGNKDENQWTKEAWKNTLQSLNTEFKRSAKRLTKQRQSIDLRQSKS